MFVRLVLLLLARLGASRADDRWLGGPPIINLHPPKMGGSTLCVAAQAMGLTPILNCRLPADSALYDNALGPFPLPDPDGPNGPLNCSARVALADRVRVRYTDNERYLQAEDAPAPPLPCAPALRYLTALREPVARACSFLDDVHTWVEREQRAVGGHIVDIFLDALPFCASRRPTRRVASRRLTRAPRRPQR